MRRLFPIGTIMALATALGCAAPQTDVAADDADIRRTNQEYIALFPQGNVPALVSLYTEDALLMPPGEEPVEGLGAVREFWTEFFDGWEVLEANSTIDEVIVAGDWAYGRGTFSETLREKASGTIVVDAGKFSGLWRHGSDGSWKIARDMWNTSSVADLGG